MGSKIPVRRPRNATKSGAAWGAQDTQWPCQPSRPPLLPKDLAEALGKTAVTERYVALPPSYQREYLAWIESAKVPVTRARHIAKAIEMLSGNPRA